MCYNFVDDDGASDTGLSTGAAVVVTFVVTLLVSVTVTAIISFIVAYVCVKRSFERAHNPNDKSLQQRVIYEEVSLPSHATIAIKNNLELQLNRDKVVMDTDPAYASCK